MPNLLNPRSSLLMPFVREWKYLTSPKVLAYDQTGPVKGSVTTLKSIVILCQQCQVVVRMAGK